MLEFDFRSDLGYWIHIAAHRFEQVMSRELRSEGISYRQCQVLAWLALEGELCQARLAELMNVQPPTVVKIIDRMERDGLIVRKACESDRRKRFIRPTKKAVPVWKKIVQCGDRVRQLSEQGLSEKEVVQLRSLIERVYDNLDTHKLPPQPSRSKQKVSKAKLSKANASAKSTKKL